jgi:4-amino-4-deoxy-L-arabinose transferase-like glycosyltransferase
MASASPWQKHAHLIASVILILGLFFYLYHIDRWLMDDDEGNFCYASWRVAAGEVPFRDFLTEQVPLFLYWGGTIVRIFGPSLLALRYATVLATLLTAFVVYLTAREVFGYRVALLSLPLFLMHKDVYFVARLFRPEVYMLLFSVLGAYAFVRAYPAIRRGSFLSGALFGLAMLFKLFAALPIAGCALFLLWRLYRSRDRRMMGHLAALAVGFGATAGTALVLFQIRTPLFFGAVIRYQFVQGAELSPWQVVIKGLQFFWSYLKGNPAFVLLALLGAALSVAQVLRLAIFGARQEAGIGALYAWQIPTATAFLIISRTVQDRYLVYLVPALSVLVAVSLERIARGLLAPFAVRRGGEENKASASGSRELAQTAVSAQAKSRRTNGALVVLLAVLSLWPSWRGDLAVASWEEHETLQIAQYIQAHTAPDAIVLCDYPELNFYALRKSTYFGSSISGYATQTGQITGADLIQGIEAENVQMVWINTHGGAHQLVSLRDYDDFYRYVQRHFQLVRLFQRAYQTFEVYHRQDLMPLRPAAEFGGKLALTGAQLGSGSVESGRPLSLALRWQALEPMPRDYTVSLRLLDAEGHQYGQKDVLLQRTFTSGWQGAQEQIGHVSTSQWPSGVQVMDEYVLPIAPATPPGKYWLGVLLYDLASGEVLPVRDALGQARGVDYPLAMVEVARPERAPALDELAIHQQINQDFGGDLRLLGRGPVVETARPGDSLRVALFWQALRDMEQDWQLVLRVRGADGNLLAEGRFEPANAGHPTSEWSENEVVMGQYDLVLDRNAVAGQAQLMLDWIDAATGQRMLQTDYTLTQVSIVGQSRQFTVPETIQHRLDANLGDRVSLLGYDLMQDAVPAGGSVHLTLYWQALTTMQTGYTVFTHLLGSDGHVWGQKDSVPLQGFYPTTAWLSGEVVADPYVIEVPADAPVGEYVLEVGMYAAASGERLPALDASGQRVDDRVLLPPVRVGN